MKVAIETVGCKLNQAEAEAIAREMAAAGHHVVTRIEEADVYILNTCTVTATADAKSRHLLRQAGRLNPRARVVATGCYAQREPDKASSIPGVSVVGNEGKGHLLSLLVGASPNTRPPSQSTPPGAAGEKHSGAGDDQEPSHARLPGRRTRAFIKIQDGCLGSCAFCIVPMVRRRQESVALDRVLEEISDREREGYLEVVLTGTEIGAYFYEGRGLVDLVEAILHRTSVPRLRLSSLQPSEIGARLLSMWQDPRLCPHLHISLQSGCEATLRRMRRGYSMAGYVRAISAVRNRVPDVAVTTDVIVGFPGETDDEFEESYDLCRELGFARIHVFPFSPRPGTAAASLPDHVAGPVKKKRAQRMLALARESARSYRRTFIGKVRPVLWESRTSAGVWTGLTDNYITAQVTSTEDLANRILPFRIK